MLLAAGRLVRRVSIYACKTLIVPIIAIIIIDALLLYGLHTPIGMRTSRDAA